MRRKFTYLFILCALTIVFTCNFVLASADSVKVYLGGMPAGFSLQTRGVKVVGLCDVVNENVVASPSKDGGIEIGDLILNINGNEVNNAVDIENSLTEEKVVVEIKREDKILCKTIKPEKDVSGKFKLGIFIQDSVNGIGTITYFKDNRFASLGHAVIDENGETMQILGGNLYNCNVTGIIKGERGKAGELKGVFLRSEPIAKIDKNLSCGVYGELSENYNFDNLKSVNIGDARVGEATIYSTVDGTNPKEYSISIIKIDNFGENKNFVIKITDKDLIMQTSGIVQGMSGSPIIQNNKLIGAVTHVFINDPTRGFGISISNMINN